MQKSTTQKILLVLPIIPIIGLGILELQPKEVISSKQVSIKTVEYLPVRNVFGEIIETNTHINVNTNSNIECDFKADKKISFENGKATLEVLKGKWIDGKTFYKIFQDDEEVEVKRS